MKSQDIINQVSDFFNVSTDDIVKGKSKVHRQVSIYLCYKYTICTYESLCTDFGLKSKSAIARAVKNVNNYRKTFIPISSKLPELEERIRGGK